MRMDEELRDLSLPPQLVANEAFPFGEKIAAARRFLKQRGITEVRPIYGRGAANRPRPAATPSVEEKALARWFDVRCAGMRSAPGSARTLPVCVSPPGASSATHAWPTEIPPSFGGSSQAS
jgi:hypothetical protein